jgi:hypothetical protein
MRKVAGAMAIAASIAAILGGSSPVAAAPETLTGTGELVKLEFVTTDTITCADGTTAARTTETSFVAENILFDPSGTPVDVDFQVRSVTIWINDGCTGQTTQLDGALFFGRGLYEQTSDGKSAVVSAGIPLFNRTEGTDGGEVFIDLVFTATGSPAVTVTQDRIVGPDGKTVFRTKMKLRDAVVTGTFILDGRDLLAGAQILEATIGTETLVSRSQVTTG